MSNLSSCHQPVLLSRPSRTRRTVAVASQPRETTRPAVKQASTKTPDQGRVFYFAFGANLAQSVVQRRGLKPARCASSTNWCQWLRSSRYNHKRLHIAIATLMHGQLSWIPCSAVPGTVRNYKLYFQHLGGEHLMA